MSNVLSEEKKQEIIALGRLGCLPLDDMGATIFFQLVSARYERGSLILTPNKSYEVTSAVGGVMIYRRTHSWRRAGYVAISSSITLKPIRFPNRLRPRT